MVVGQAVHDHAVHQAAQRRLAVVVGERQAPGGGVGEGVFEGVHQHHADRAAAAGAEAGADGVGPGVPEPGAGPRAPPHQVTKPRFGLQRTGDRQQDGMRVAFAAAARIDSRWAVESFSGRP